MQRAGQKEKEGGKERESKEYRGKKEGADLDFSQKRRHTESHNEDQLTSKIVRQENQRHHSDSGKTLFLRGVPEGWDKAGVLELFDNKEEVEDVRIVSTHKKRRTNDNEAKYTNVCYVDFLTAEAAQNGSIRITQPPRTTAGRTSRWS